MIWQGGEEQAGDLARRRGASSKESWTLQVHLLWGAVLKDVCRQLREGVKEGSVALQAPTGLQQGTVVLPVSQ